MQVFSFATSIHYVLFFVFNYSQSIESKSCLLLTHYFLNILAPSYQIWNCSLKWKILITRSSQSVIVNNRVDQDETPSACGQTLFAFYSLLLLKHKTFTDLWALCPFESFYNIWPPKVHQNFPTLHLDTQRVVGISQQVRLYEKKTQNALCWQGQIMQLFCIFLIRKIIPQTCHGNTWVILQGIALS